LNRTEDGGLRAHFFIGVNATEKVTDLIEPSLRAMGFELVRVLLQGNQRPTLQVMAERIDRSPMTVEDCAEISRAVSALLDVEDPIPSAYHLEVTSPGLDRPLTRPADFERFAGFEARIETQLPVDGRRRFRGRLLGLAGAEVRLELPEGEQRLALDGIRKAKLVLTDDLLAASRRERRS
jgi:ribosome maturation factor RimP